MKQKRQYEKIKCHICEKMVGCNNIKQHIKIHEDKNHWSNKICLNCEIPFNANSVEDKFCGYSCSAKYNNARRSYDPKNDIRKKVGYCKKCGQKIEVNIRSGLSKIICSKCKKLKRYKCVCKICNKTFQSKTQKGKSCSKKCLHELLSRAGRKSSHIQGDNRRSKNEIYFAELCEEYFINIKTNEPIFNGWDADVIIEDIKVAVMWNGIWHYKKITEKHSVKQVQNRDKIKINEIKKCGYTPYIIKDIGKYSKKKVNKEFKKFITFLK